MGSVTSPISDRRATVALFSRLRTVQGQADPFPLYAELRSRGDVSPAPWGGFLVTGFGACDQVLRSGTWLDPLLVSHFVLLVAESEGAREAR